MVDDVRLVEDVEVFHQPAHRGYRQSKDRQQDARGSTRHMRHARDDARLLPHQLSKGAQGDGRGIRYVPGSAQGLVACAHHHHRPSNIANKAHAVGHVWIREHLDLLSGEQRTKEPLTDQRLGHVRAKQV
ncbi:MAG TPA: hypothetical protein VGL99_23165 [Chloroflexota bacterium]